MPDPGTRGIPRVTSNHGKTPEHGLEGGSDRDHSGPSDQVNSGDAPKSVRRETGTRRRRAPLGKADGRGNPENPGECREILQGHQDVVLHPLGGNKLGHLAQPIVAMTGGVGGEAGDNLTEHLLTHGSFAPPEGGEDLAKASREDQIDPQVNRDDGAEAFHAGKQSSLGRSRKRQFSAITSPLDPTGSMMDCRTSPFSGARSRISGSKR